MLAMRHKVFRVGLERFGWRWRFGFRRSLKVLADLRGRVGAFADEVGPEHVVSINESGRPLYTITVWYREEVKARPKPAKVGVGDEYFAAAGG